MPCFKPLTAYRNCHGEIVFNPPKQDTAPMELPCGQCIGCRLERSRQWAMRCVHEAELHDDNCFITLTFSPEELNKRDNPYTVDVRDFQLFMKRLRKRFTGTKIRYYHCGEYGEKYGRPHYHAILFGLDFPDKELHKITDSGHRLYRSDILDSVWSFGHAWIGEVTFESAAYVARYCMKKVTGDHAEAHYLVVDDETGEVLGERKPEYASMSRRPGIAADWFKKYKGDVYPKDFITLNGKKLKPPKFYDYLLEKEDPFELEYHKDMRKIRGMDNFLNNTDERLAVREKVQQAKLNQLLRPLEG